MKAITLWQPHASLVAEGMKPYDFQRWASPIVLTDTRIAIHASKRPMKGPELHALIDKLRALPSDRHFLLGGFKAGALAFLERVAEGKVELPLGCFVCTAILGRSLNFEEFGRVLGIRFNEDANQEHFHYAWPLTSIERLPDIPHSRGAKGFWPVPHGLMKGA